MTNSINLRPKKTVPPSFQVVDTVEPGIFPKTYGLMGADGTRRSLTAHKRYLATIRHSIILPPVGNVNKPTPPLLPNDLLTIKAAKLESTLERRAQFFNYMANANRSGNSFKALGQWYLRKTTHAYPINYGKKTQVGNPKIIPLIHINYSSKRSILNSLNRMAYLDKTKRGREKNPNRRNWEEKTSSETFVDKLSPQHLIQHPDYIITGAHGNYGITQPLRIGGSKKFRTTLKNLFLNNPTFLVQFFNKVGRYQVCTEACISKNHFSTNPSIKISAPDEIFLKLPEQVVLYKDMSPPENWSEYTTTTVNAGLPADKNIWLQKLWELSPRLRELNGNQSAPKHGDWFRVVS
jgi:hypothetical protein